MPAPSSPSRDSKNPLRGAVEILHGKLYYAALASPPSSSKLVVKDPRNPARKVNLKCFCIDDELVYWNFFKDFGPLNLGQLFRFTAQLNRLLQQQQQQERKLKQQKQFQNYPSEDSSPPAILFWSSTNPSKRANAIYLICAWQVLELRRTPEQALHGFFGWQQESDQLAFARTSSRRRRRHQRHKAKEDYSEGDEETEEEEEEVKAIPTSGALAGGSWPPQQPLTGIGKATVAPLPPFHDASPIPCTYDLTIRHCLEGLVQAKYHGFFDFSTFDVDEYEHFEQVENGDLNWICQNKILAFAGPSFHKTVSREGYCTLAPSDYIPYFQAKKVGLVVRLNKKNYEEQDFLDAGIDHLEQFYLDGSCPPMSILRTVLEAFEAVPPGKAFAVHCKAGLGRTGTCIGAYLMKHYQMKASEVIAWMRICRPGMVIGPQQQFLRDLEPVMWQEGAAKQISRNLPPAEVEASNSTEEVGANGKRKKKATKTTTQWDSEAEAGRPGQADGLLARRQKTTTPSASTPSRRKRETPGAVPVTPESSAAGSTDHVGVADDHDGRPPPSWVHASTSLLGAGGKSLRTTMGRFACGVPCGSTDYYAPKSP